ncbi:A/G-specific adenine glycosylase [Aquimarina sp. ERC-38]|uniref:A/G-specific adenine glycosylase n=1 Tax=Aquimarina sp. ERC-38 TaxID=2949996 RepID=UPI00224510E8|nr:A/G-specific adenine glycosylase [Aquimarina sp. ERC-38]UZO82646.1 A/G-specific adenine glycosylase [Aquimarina sp. ERC-38]
MYFSKKLISWYLQNKRSMPWRETTDPYHIWLSEIILQQTRVAQGLPYYNAFIEAFPTVFELAEAEEETVLKLWQGLGYYSRARNLHYTAKQIVSEYGGQFPNSYKELLKLKGVGDYTASAIASICFKEPTPVVDGNVYRVLSRYFKIATPINSTAGIKEFKEIALQVIDTEQPDTYNQAIMEFGALQCKPQNPYCIICPLNESCAALQKGSVSELPVKLKKSKIKKRYFTYLLFVIKDVKTILQKRTEKGIWQNLYEFPLLEFDKAPKSEKLIFEHPLFQNMVKDTVYQIEKIKDYHKVHKLSHQHLYTEFYIIHTETVPELTLNQEEIKLSELRNYPVPILIGNAIDYIEKNQLIL